MTVVGQIIRVNASIKQVLGAAITQTVILTVKKEGMSFYLSVGCTEKEIQDLTIFKVLVIGKILEVKNRQIKVEKEKYIRVLLKECNVIEWFKAPISIRIPLQPPCTTLTAYRRESRERRDIPFLFIIKGEKRTKEAAILQCIDEKRVFFEVVLQGSMHKHFFSLYGETAIITGACFIQPPCKFYRPNHYVIIAESNTTLEHSPVLEKNHPVSKIVSSMVLQRIFLSSLKEINTLNKESIITVKARIFKIEKKTCTLVLADSSGGIVLRLTKEEIERISQQFSFDRSFLLNPDSFLFCKVLLQGTVLLLSNRWVLHTIKIERDKHNETYI